ncbi:hypothetical protein SAMN02745166_03493 [Prosthecobacter debontii]|uniref:Uncharacterized protein n=1 Tax=Prosthecobacter debontii TaxID=48467 RepID=A0A1T4YJL7_9BACT|nr:hypothetical protein SAMN02745166_03493 [Prosthecobacter debontii]
MKNPLKLIVLFIKASCLLFFTILFGVCVYQLILVIYESPGRPFEAEPREGWCYWRRKELIEKAEIFIQYYVPIILLVGALLCWRWLKLIKNLMALTGTPNSIRHGDAIKITIIILVSITLLVSTYKLLYYGSCTDLDTSDY